MWETAKISVFNSTTTIWTKLLVLSVPISLIKPHVFGYTLNEVLMEGLFTSSFVFVTIYLAKTSSIRTLVETASYFNCVIRNKETEVNYYMPEGIPKEEEDKRIYKFKW